MVKKYVHEARTNTGAGINATQKTEIKWSR